MAEADKEPAEDQSAMELLASADCKREDQGCHECEVWPEGCLEGSYFWDNCQKNPEHKNFTAVQDFTIDHLPEIYRETCVLKCVQLMAKLTVRLRVGYTSPRRPDGYVFSGNRDKFITHVGTGYVGGVCRGDIKSTCPCPECEQSMEPHKKFWTISVWTAKHVMFDTLEAKHTVCDVFYDTPTSEGKHLYGVRGAKGSLETDRSWLICVTHDRNLAHTLNKAHEDVVTLRTEVENKFTYNLRGDTKGKRIPLVIICSHPHGYVKRISVGKWHGRQKHSAENPDDVGVFEKTSYTYNNATCRGSSGALVFVLGEGAGGYTYTSRYGLFHPHSGSSDLDGGRSGISTEVYMT